MYVCLSVTGKIIICKFSRIAPWCSRDDSGAKFGEVMGRGTENWHFPFATRLSGHVTDEALGTGHKGTGKQCKDVIYACIDADGLAYILHMGMESKGLRQVKGGMGLPT